MTSARKLWSDNGRGWGEANGLGGYNRCHCSGLRPKLADCTTVHVIFSIPENVQFNHFIKNRSVGKSSGSNPVQAEQVMMEFLQRVRVFQVIYKRNSATWPIFVYFLIVFSV